MEAIARSSSRSNPRRFGISSRKSVSADACSSSIRASACANWVRSLRIVDLASLGAAGEPDAGFGFFAGRARADTAGGFPAAFLRRFTALFAALFAALGPAALVFFFIGLLGSGPVRQTG